jgi:NTE family protein
MGIICNAVFEGGGVRGVGLAGAVAALEDGGVKFAEVAGTSVGAMVAALLAAGYSGAELRAEIENLDFKQFKSTGGAMGLAKTILNINRELGIYESAYFENYLSKLLLKKGVTTFADLKKPLKITAVDTTDNKLLILPDDLAHFGIDPRTFSVARAVRMSISIPLFFKPCSLRDAGNREHLIVDGGVLSNNPAFLLENGKYPLVNFRFENLSKDKNAEKEPRPGVFEYVRNLIGMVLDDSDSVRNKGGEQIIYVNTAVTVGGRTKSIKSVNFDITRAESDALYKNGYSAGQSFLSAGF